MPDKDVKTIRDLIYYQYAKIIAKSTFSKSDGREVKRQHCGFIKKTFKDLQSGAKSWSKITREDKQFVEAEKKCIYCEAESELCYEHIIPRSLQVTPQCKTCEEIQGIHNQVWACKRCNSLKGTKGLYEFFKAKYLNEKKFYDFIPRLLEKKYLKLIYNCHECAQTLNSGDIDCDGELSVLDIDFVLRQTSPQANPKYAKSFLI